MTVFCQGNKDHLTAAATYQHSERECKSALMQMSYVFRGKTDGLYNQPPQHNTLLSVLPEPPDSPPLLYWKHTHTNTSRRQSCAERECVITRDNIIFLLHTTQKGHSTVGSLHKYKHFERERDKLTCLSWRRLANTDSLKILFTFLHAVGNGRGRGPGQMSQHQSTREGKSNASVNHSFAPAVDGQLQKLQLTIIFNIN